MKSAICSTTITILFLAYTTVGKAQDKPINIKQPVADVPSAGSPARSDTLKIKKKNKHKKAAADAAYNPYQPPPPVSKPLPYNSYPGKPAPEKNHPVRILSKILSPVKERIESNHIHPIPKI